MPNSEQNAAIIIAAISFAWIVTGAYVTLSGARDQLLEELQRPQFLYPDYPPYAPPLKWPENIPRVLHFVRKGSVPRGTPLAENILRTERLFTKGAGKESTIFHWDDARCRNEIAWVAPALARSFDVEGVGAFKADICRLVVLHIHGGLYVDDDIEFIVGPSEVGAVMPPPSRSRAKCYVTLTPVIMRCWMDQILVATDTLVSATELHGGGIFQAFLACTRGHPVLIETLALIEKVYNGELELASLVPTARTSKGAAVGELLLGPITLRAAAERHPHRWLRESCLETADPLWREAGLYCNAVVRADAGPEHGVTSNGDRVDSAPDFRPLFFSHFFDPSGVSRVNNCRHDSVDHCRMILDGVPMAQWRG